MKNVLYIILLTGFLFSSCEDDIEKTMISADPSAPTLTAPASSGGLAFTKDDAESNIDFTWTGSDFGFDASITYGVQMATNSSFETKATLFTTQELSGAASVGDINAKLLAWKFPIGESATISSRVFATVGAGTDSVFSEAKEYTVTPYETLIDYPMIYVPGAYQGWAPGEVNGRLFSYNFDNVYEGVIRLNGGDPVEFKIAPAPNWDNSWGGSLTPSGNNYSGTLDPSGGNFSVAAGTYQYVVNTADLTIEMTKTDDWGIIGSAIPPYDWSADADLFYNGQRQKWEITADLDAGEFKFRANDDWALNYGDTGADGSLEAGGDNIQLTEAGNYTIRLDLINNTYKVEKN